MFRTPAIISNFAYPKVFAPGALSNMLMRCLAKKAIARPSLKRVTTQIRLLHPLIPHNTRFDGSIPIPPDFPGSHTRTPEQLIEHINYMADQLDSQGIMTAVGQWILWNHPSFNSKVAAAIINATKRLPDGKKLCKFIESRLLYGSHMEMDDNIYEALTSAYVKFVWLKDAMRCFELIKERQPSHYTSLMAILAASGQKNAAVEVYGRLVVENKLSVTELMTAAHAAILHASFKQPQVAMELLNELVIQYDHQRLSFHFAAMVARGFLRQSPARTEGARATMELFLQTATPVGTDLFRANLVLAECFAHEGNPDRAAELLTPFIDGSLHVQMSPDDLAACENVLARAYARVGAFDRAESYQLRLYKRNADLLKSSTHATATPISTIETPSLDDYYGPDVYPFRSRTKPISSCLLTRTTLLQVAKAAVAFRNHDALRRVDDRARLLYKTDKEFLNKIVSEQVALYCEEDDVESAIAVLQQFETRFNERRASPIPWTRIIHQLTKDYDKNIKRATEIYQELTAQDFPGHRDLFWATLLRLFKSPDAVPYLLTYRVPNGYVTPCFGLTYLKTALELGIHVTDLYWTKNVTNSRMAVDVDVYVKFIDLLVGNNRFAMAISVLTELASRIDAGSLAPLASDVTRLVALYTEYRTLEQWESTHEALLDILENRHAAASLTRDQTTRFTQFILGFKALIQREELEQEKVAKASRRRSKKKAVSNRVARLLVETAARKKSETLRDLVKKRKTKSL